jgi:hypothetical protein
MPRYFPLTVAASPSRPMNLGVPHEIARGDTCLRRNWGKRNKQVRSSAGEGRVDPRGASLAAAN